MSAASNPSPKGVITNESQMILALREHFKSPEYALLPQVRNGTGFAREPRTADALVMGLWPSRGIYLHGIEIKVSRSDWLREKDAPEKAEEIGRFCDFWWIAAGSDKIVLEGELPADWGLLIPNAQGKLRVQSPANKRAEPVPISRIFLASILRKTVDSAPVFTDVDAAIQKRVEAETEKVKKSLEQSQDFHTKRRLEDADKLRKNVEAFEKASGIHIDRYSDYFSTEIGEAVKALRQAGKDLSVKRKLAETERILSRQLEDLRSQREALERVWPEPIEAEATP